MHESWLLSCIYASSYRKDHNILWKNLPTIKDSYNGKWLIGGDFNELISILENKGGRPIIQPRTSDFRNL